MNVLRYSLVCLVSFVFLTNTNEAQEIDRLLAAGEFARAKQIANQAGPQKRDPFLAQIASAQSSSGETAAAGGTIRGIDSAVNRGQAINGAQGAAGGGSFADFQSLMDLVQTTVVPETWEALGGPSTMAPYPQGVYVDPSGTVHPCESFADSNAVENLKSLLARPDDRKQADSWRQASNMRCVSIRRLLDEQTRNRINGVPNPESMVYLAGLSEVQYIFIHGDDIILAGPVGGVEDFRGWFRDRESGLNTLRLDFLSTCIGSAMGKQPFGCTIDPTTEGLQNAASVGTAVQSDEIPIGKAADAMINALGMQRVEVFGTAGDTPVGYMMVEADRHMKQLALGIDPMPTGAKSYLDVIDATIAQGPPDELLLRLWFTSAPRAVRADPARKVFELAGTPIRLSGQNERALATGVRGHVVRDPRSESFVADFNRNWGSIRSKYPIYGALESVYQAASVAELLNQHSTPALRELLQALSANDSSENYGLNTPRQVKTIAVLHQVRHGRKRHNVVVASGGVAVDSQQTLTSKIVDYPSLDSLTKPTANQPKLVQRWWWNAR